MPNKLYSVQHNKLKKQTRTFEGPGLFRHSGNLVNHLRSKITIFIYLSKIQVVFLHKIVDFLLFRGERKIPGLFLHSDIPASSAGIGLFSGTQLGWFWKLFQVAQERKVRRFVNYISYQ